MRRPWIKIETSTPDKPEICSLATQLKLDEDTVVGKLVRLWSWAELNRINPNDLGVTREFIDKLVGRKGFALALEKTGWLLETDGKLSFRNFKRHNSPVAQNKALTAKRVARHRLRKASSNDPVTKPELAKKVKTSPKTKEIGTSSNHDEEVNIADESLVISEEHNETSESVIAENVTVAPETAIESPSVVEEPEMPPPALPEEVIEEVAVIAHEVVIEAPPEAVAVAAPVEEPAPRKRRGKAAAETEDQPLLF